MPPSQKPALVKITSKSLLQALGLNVWGMGSVPRDATSWIEKDDL